MDIDTLLLQDEGKTLEFKENCLSRDKILHTIIAFANTSGGKIIMGIEDKTKRLVGLLKPYEEEEKLTSCISDSVTPGLLFNTEIIAWRDIHLIVIDVPMSGTKPHYIKSKGIEKSCYVRVGASNRLADEPMRNSIQRSGQAYAYDEEICPHATESDIDLSVAKEAFAPIRPLTFENMLSLGIVKHHHDSVMPTIGGILFFSHRRRTFFPDAWIQAGCFQGVNKTTVLDTADIHTCFHQAVDDTLNFIRKNIKVGLDIQDVAHTERWEVPKAALREAILNAITHCDYMLTGTPLRIAIFDDRIEIENPGLLVNGLCLEDIKSGVSKIRNRVIARIFREIKYIEQWGSGIGRIIDSCHDFGLPPPVFEEIADRFRVTLFRKRLEPIHLDDLEIRIIAIITEMTRASTKEIAQKTTYSEKTIRGRLTKLIEKGLVQEISKSAHDPFKKFMVTKP